MVDSMVIYANVVELDTSITADELYTAAKSWAIDAFKSTKEVIQEADKELHLIYIKGFIKANVYGGYWFTIKIETKDGRYRYSLYDIIYDASATVMGVTSRTTQPIEVSLKEANTKERGQKYYKGVDEKFRALLNSLEIRMQDAQTDDW